MKQNIRSLFFWLLDGLKGAPVRRHYLDIRKVMEGEEVGKAQLNKIFCHVKDTVPYYKGKSLQCLTDFPVIDKMTIKNDYELFLSDAYRNRKLHSMSTSGSTGTPFTVKMNKGKRRRVIAELIYFNEMAGQNLGQKYLYLKTWKKKKPVCEKLVQNVELLDVLVLDHGTLDEITGLLKKKRSINSILSYASVYESLIRYLDETGYKKNDFQVQVIFSSSTLLKEETYWKLKGVFQCPVIDRYSNQENGLLAQSTRESRYFVVNQGSYLVELLALKSDEPVKSGEIGRVVITDLYNLAMPMIRYDTGDLAVAEEMNAQGISILKNVSGRRVDAIYDTKGNMLSAHTWSVHMRKYERLKQWQFIQHTKDGYELILNGGRYYTDEDYRKTLKKVLGQNAGITISHVETITVTQSGKFKNTICLYDPDKDLKM